MVESKLSDRLWLSFSLALAKPNNSIYYEENGTDWDVTHVRDAEHRI